MRADQAATVSTSPHRPSQEHPRPALMTTHYLADMSIWPNIVTGVCTLLAGLGGVWITQRGTTARTIEEWRDKHRIDQRQAVVEVLHRGRQWTHSMGMMRSAIAVSPTGRDLMSLLDKYNLSYGDDHLQFQRALTAARIVVSIEEITVHLQALTALGNPVLTGSTGLLATSEPDEDKRIAAVDVPGDEADEILDHLEKAAVKHLGAPVPQRVARPR